MNRGKLVGGAIVGFALIFGIVVYYTQIYAYYEQVDAETVTIRLTPLGGQDAPEPMLATNLQAIDGSSSPLRFRACFDTSESLALLTESYVIHDAAVPLNAPGWFDCFDAARIGADLRDGTALAFLGEAEIADGVDRIVAVYRDGRAFAWHQLNEKFAD
ncbi:hypothetical protein Dshi_2403 [Dinoroseobacter shibae DFL 12 = DSM 16493]|jgi:hypothetical protein|uniref:Histidine kinase n=2 Tax=Pseudomonadota TaxID=1224 RepID=A8LS46_DINSH|nr:MULTISPECIES: DUF6446 family protein [Dinoroseobacter]ABV94139.1 hypothetical protein Dshi_2403 [Dinoroseobacter shibae DFL 12 = DSM 16493]MDD9716346.1 DUF6446 family protein [Dinoroseobacter sp. PD6]URF45579.1 DUF6446 family protein [Dinoroseobacter shibae]URF49884.1 DUF6446 family protein [Dinoroseobacter shibae]